jgi:hypothetical protein
MDIEGMVGGSRPIPGRASIDQEHGGRTGIANAIRNGKPDTLARENKPGCC